MSELINNILLVGGTHGNELSGVRLVEHWQSISTSFDLNQLQVNTLIANPSAVEKRVRFVEEDLNRQFSRLALTNQATSKEAQLAHTLNHKFGVESKVQPHLVIDVHNTTSNMGATLILVDTNPFNQQLARFVNAKLPECNILLEDDQSYENHPYLCTLGKYGLMIEMGAQPQGVCRADVFSQTLDLLKIILEFAQMWNTSSVPELPQATVFQFIENINFPMNHNGLVDAMVSPTIQDKDFNACELGDSIFEKFDGQTITWQQAETVYPHFINEAAYQGTNVAFATARKIKW